MMLERLTKAGRELSRLGLLALAAAGAWLAPDLLPTAEPGAQPLTAKRSAILDAQLHLAPGSISLSGAGAHTRLAAWIRRADGVTAPVPGELIVRSEPAGLVRYDAASGRLIAAEDGVGALHVSSGELRAQVPLQVANSTAARPASFSNDVLPIVTRFGCNAGGCHGAAAGQEGFHLSLFAYDPGADHRALTRELGGRRIDRAEPSSSLMLRKGTGAVAHGGGAALPSDGEAHAALTDWIAAGAPSDVGRAPALEALELRPRELVFDGAGQALPLVVTARWSDGRTEDVTERAILSSSDPALATVSADGRIAVADPEDPENDASPRIGETHVLARFGPLAEVAQVLVVRPAPEGFVAEVAAPAALEDAAATAAAIDALVEGKLRRLRIEPAPLVDAAGFARRIHLDLAGRLPTPEELRAFLADDREDAREQLIDRLAYGPEFAQRMALEWAELLRLEERILEEKGMHRTTEWLQERFLSRAPFDETVRLLLTATGGSFENPATNFWLVDRDPKIQAETVGQLFLGVRVQCAQCHDHPFERWTMDDYYGFAAFFPQIAVKRAEDQRERVVMDRNSGEVRHPIGNAVVAPRFLGGDAWKRERGGPSRREALATWLTSSDTPLFTESLANRMWARLTGRGLVEPVDDVRVSNPPSHPELFRHLGRRFRTLGFDFARLAAEIARTRTYQRDVHPEAIPAPTQGGRIIRRLDAESLMDAIAQVTGVPHRLRNLPAGSSASAVRGVRGIPAFLELFGRPKRETSCACERRVEPTLGQALHLINGDTLLSRIESKEGHLQRDLAAGKSDEQLLNALWERAYARAPGEQESAALLARIPEGEERTAAWVDLTWAVLNSKEFLFCR